MERQLSRQNLLTSSWAYASDFVSSSPLPVESISSYPDEVYRANDVALEGHITPSFLSKHVLIESD